MDRQTDERTELRWLRRDESSSSAFVRKNVRTQSMQSISIS